VFFDDDRRSFFELREPWWLVSFTPPRFCALMFFVFVSKVPVGVYVAAECIRLPPK